MPCDIQTFSGFTQSRFDALAQKAHASGIEITDNEGTASKNGVTMRWSYDPAAQTLEIQCMDLPFFVPCDFVTTKIQSLVDECPDPADSTR